MKSRFVGRCRVCGDAINIGVEIVDIAADKVTDPPVWVHEECGVVKWGNTISSPPEEPLKLVRPVCPLCNIELPASGVCGFC
jgi:hypothetical protein